MNAICFILTSFLIAIVLIVKYYKRQLKTINTDVSKNNRNYKISLLFFAISSIWLFAKTKPLIDSLPVDYRISDIIPTIQIVVKQFLSNQNPYDRHILQPLGYAIPTAYLPMHWGPYCMAELLKIDYRWISFVIWLVGFCILTLRTAKYRTISVNLFITLVVSGLYFLVTDKDSGIISTTVEMMVAGYYIIFIISLNQKNAYVQGLVIGICLLSRYSLALWLPLWAFIIYISGNRSFLFKSIGTAASFVLLMYIIPFLSKDWLAFYDSHMAYENGAIWEWRHLCESGLPCHLFNGLGLAQFFYKAYTNLSLQKGYELQRSIMFVGLILSCLIFAIWYWFNKNMLDYKIALMASFKIYITIFFALIIVPYNYIIIVGNFVSVAIFAEQLRYKIKS